MSWRDAVIGATVLFVVFLLVKMRPASSARAKLSADVRAARERAYRATDHEERGQAFCEAGELSAKQGRWTAAAGFFLRAMLAAPSDVRTIERTTAALAKRRPRLLEKILWRKLAHVPWDDEHRDVVRAAAAGLAHVYQGELRDGSRAEAMQKLARLHAPVADASREG